MQEIYFYDGISKISVIIAVVMCMKDILKNCNLCPRNCFIDRSLTTGVCGMKDKLVIARASLHMWEEPCISGDTGSGTIFFTGCNLKCIFCQNHEISTTLIGKEVTTEEFANICLNLQKQGANNINLVTPTHFVPLIIEGIKLAKEKGLTLPIVYNTSSYEKVETIKMLDGIVDIYLPDLKYYDDTYAIKYSHAPNYFNIATTAIKEMVKQVGLPTFQENGIMKKGVIVRHLMMPGLKEDTKNILEYLYKNYHDDIYISIMNQYTPIKHFTKYQELNQKILDDDYDEVINYALDLGIKKAFIQEGNTASESFIPDFSNQKLPI